MQAKRVPIDKLDWKPMDAGRSILDQLAECALIPAFYPAVVQTKQMPDFTPELMEAFEEDKNRLNTLEKAEALLRENTAKAVAAFLAVPDDDLEVEMKFFGPGVWKLASVMHAHVWNMHWHTGQICYIQTLLGDKAMG